MKLSRSFILDGFFILLLIALTVAFFQVLRPFLLDIFLAVVLTDLTWRLYDTLSRKLKRPFASFLSVLIFFVITAGFLTLLGFLFAQEAADGFAAVKRLLPQVKKWLTDNSSLEFLKNIPVLNSLSRYAESLKLGDTLSQLLKAGTETLINFTTRSFAGLSRGILHFILILFLMYFLYLNGPVLLKRVSDLIPLGDEETDELLKEIVNITRATAISTVVIGVIEGFFGCILFYIFKLPSPILWGLLMMIVSMVPLIGTNIILIPTGIILIATGRWTAGLLIIILGFAGISASQYVLKPKLLGGRSGLHPAIVLLSILGGLIWLGVIGFLVGPLIAALFIVIWNQFGKRFKEELDRKNLPRT